jgi:hypothetical protein
MAENKQSFYLIFAISLLIELIIQLLMSGQAIVGDHVAYKNYFDFISLSNFRDFLATDSAGFIGSYDYLYNFIVFLFSRFSNFNFFTFFINIPFYFVFVILFTRLKMVLVLPLLPFTFYVIGIQFSAQRLMLAITIFSLAYLYAKTLLSFLSLFAHVQVAPLFLVYYKKIQAWLIVFILLTIPSLAYFFDTNASQKLLLYAANRPQIQFNDFMFMIYLFFAIGSSCPRSVLKNLTLPFLAFSVLIFIIGDGRINIIIFIYSLLFLQNIKKISLRTKFLYCIFLAYDSIKGVQFILGVMDGNSGFDSIGIN